MSKDEISQVNKNFKIQSTKEIKRSSKQNGKNLNSRNHLTRCSTSVENKSNRLANSLSSRKSLNSNRNTNLADKSTMAVNSPSRKSSRISVRSTRLNRSL